MGWIEMIMQRVRLLAPCRFLRGVWVGNTADSEFSISQVRRSCVGTRGEIHYVHTDNNYTDGRPAAWGAG